MRLDRSSRTLKGLAALETGPLAGTRFFGAIRVSVP